MLDGLAGYQEWITDVLVNLKNERGNLIKELFKEGYFLPEHLKLDDAETQWMAPVTAAPVVPEVLDDLQRYIKVLQNLKKGLALRPLSDNTRDIRHLETLLSVITAARENQDTAQLQTATLPALYHKKLQALVPALRELLEIDMPQVAPEASTTVTAEQPVQP